MTEHDKTDPSFERLAERIERAADELRVRAHLAGLDARDAWDRSNLQRVAGELEQLRDETRLRIHLASLEAKDAWSRIEKKLGLLSGTAGVHADELVRELVSGLGEAARSLREGRPASEHDERR